MRTAAVAVLCGSILLLASGCSGDDADEALAELEPFLLRDADVVAVLPDLEAKSDYSTGDDFGVIRRDELVGPTQDAESAVVRQWSQGMEHADEGQAWSLISSVFEFPSAEEAGSAVEALVDSIGVDPVEIEGALVGFADRDDGSSSAVAIATSGSLVSTVQIDYVGRSNELTGHRLAVALARRLP